MMTWRNRCTKKVKIMVILFSIEMSPTCKGLAYETRLTELKMDKVKKEYTHAALY